MVWLGIDQFKPDFFFFFLFFLHHYSTNTVDRALWVAVYPANLYHRQATLPRPQFARDRMDEHNIVIKLHSLVRVKTVGKRLSLKLVICLNADVSLKAISRRDYSCKVHWRRDDHAEYLMYPKVFMQEGKTGEGEGQYTFKIRTVMAYYECQLISLWWKQTIFIPFINIW